MKLTAEAVFFHCVTVLLCVLCRIMHWARRIEQEIDRVLQHISGAQQLKGVRLCVCGFSSISVKRVLITVGLACMSNTHKQ